MPRYKVRGQMIKVYDLWVEAESEEAALEAFYNTQTLEIVERGKLIDVELNFAEVWEGPDNDGPDFEEETRLQHESDDA